MQYLSDMSCNMVIIGSGEHEHDLLKKIEGAGLQKQIHMAGVMSREKALRLLSASRLLVFPSVWEGLPIAPLEAMALGLPVVASDIGGTNEIVCSGETGFLLPRFEASAYGDAIRQLLTDESKRLTFGRSGRERVMRILVIPQHAIGTCDCTTVCCPQERLFDLPSAGGGKVPRARRERSRRRIARAPATPYRHY